MTSPPDHNFTPFDSQEYVERTYWSRQVVQGELKVFRTIAGWSDICGFGCALASSAWDLSKLNRGLFRALSQAYMSLGKPLISGVPPMPSERVLVINDGIARTIDLVGSEYVEQVLLLFYIRDLLMQHYMLEQKLVDGGLGLRTVLAGGERCQYSPPKSTGHSLLSYTNEPSEFGKKLLEQEFVYNPAEFQMNTAFALAYTLEEMGSSKGLIPNRAYFETRWLNTLNDVIPGFCVLDGQTAHFLWHDEPSITIAFDDCRSVEAKGLVTSVYRICEFTVHERFEGERTVFPMAVHDL